MTPFLPIALLLVLIVLPILVGFFIFQGSDPNNDSYDDFPLDSQNDEDWLP